MTDNIKKTIKQYADIQEDQPLSRYTGFQTGGFASYLVFPDSPEKFVEVLKIIHKNKLAFYILGGGTNVVANDAGYNEIIIVTTEVDSISICEENINCGSGALLRDICVKAEKSGLAGMEFAYGIPGTIGGAVFMNAGAFDGEIRNVVETVEVINAEGEIFNINNSSCMFGYRSSIFQSDEKLSIISVNLKLNRGNKNSISSVMKDNIEKRKRNQPLEYPNCGSVFKRPEGAYASKLIDECGLKGYKLGGAMVSEKHAGFIINYDNATTKDIIELIEYIQKEVKIKTEYWLIPEIRYLG